MTALLDILSAVALTGATFCAVFMLAFTLDAINPPKRDADAERDAQRAKAIDLMRRALTAEDAAFLRRERDAERDAHQVYLDAREAYRDTFR